jgi:hypothetical protein
MTYDSNFLRCQHKNKSALEAKEKISFNNLDNRLWEKKTFCSRTLIFVAMNFYFVSNFVSTNIPNLKHFDSMFQT